MKANNCYFYIVLYWILIFSGQAALSNAQLLQENKVRAEKLLSLIHQKYQQCPSISSRCIAGLLFLTTPEKGPQCSRWQVARTLYYNMYEEGRVDEAFFVNLYRFEPEFREGSHFYRFRSLSFSSAYFYYHWRIKNNASGYPHEAIAADAELSLLFCQPIRGRMHVYLNEKECAAIFLALEPPGTIRTQVMVDVFLDEEDELSIPPQLSVKEKLSKIHANFLSLPSWKRGDSFLAGLLYHLGEKEKALNLYLSLIKTQMANRKFKEFMQVLQNLKKYIRAQHSIYSEKEYIEFILLQAMYGRMIEILIELGRSTEAEEALREGHCIFPHSARLYCIEAGMWIARGNPAHGRGLYEKALVVNPHYVPAYLGLSRLDLLEKKDSYELLDRCTKVIEFEGPESEWTTQALELMLQRLKQ